MTDRSDGRRGSGRGGSGDPTHVGDVLGGVLRSLGLESAIARHGAITRWPDVVGPGIAEVAHAVAVSADVLFVQVASSAWLTELGFMKQDILKRLNAGRSTGRIDRIVFVLAEGSPDRSAIAPGEPGADRTGGPPDDGRGRAPGGRGSGGSKGAS